MSATTPKPAAPLPEVRQDVVLTMPSRDQYGARVARVTAEEIELVLMIDARVPLALGEASPMAVEYPAPRGLVRYEGSGTVVEHDLVRFRLSGAVHVVQRRDFVRVGVVRPLQLARVSADGTLAEWADTCTVNLSGNGILVTGPDTLAVGDPVAFRISLDDEEPLEGRARVARVGEDGQRGIAIDQLDGDARRRLVRFIFEQERIARQRTRDL